GVDHDDAVGALLEREPVARLLVRPVASVDRVSVHAGTGKRPGDGRRGIVAAVVDDDHEVDDALGHHLVVRLPERARGVVGRHDDDDLLAVQHGFPPRGARLMAASAGTGARALRSGRARGVRRSPAPPPSDRSSWMTTLVQWCPVASRPNSSQSSMCEIQVSGCQLAAWPVVIAQRTFSRLMPVLTWRFSVT